MKDTRNRQAPESEGKARREPEKSGELDDDELDAVSGGVAVDGLNGTTISSDTDAMPRDASTGLPTGKRMHKPYTATS